MALGSLTAGSGGELPGMLLLDQLGWAGLALNLTAYNAVTQAADMLIHQQKLCYDHVSQVQVVDMTLLTLHQAAGHWVCVCSSFALTQTTRCTIKD